MSVKIILKSFVDQIVLLTIAINIHIRKHLNTKNHLKSFQCTFDTLEGFKSTRTTNIIALAAILPRGKRGYLLWIVVKELKCKEKKIKPGFNRVFWQS